MVELKVCKGMLQDFIKSGVIGQLNLEKDVLVFATLLYCFYCFAIREEIQWFESYKKQ